MAGELSNQVYTAPQAPDYLGHYADLVRSIPNYGLQFLAAQKAGTENQTALAQYELMKQKAKSFMELYPAWKAAQIAKLAAETSTFPYKQALLQEQAGLARARASSFGPPPEGTKSPVLDFELKPPPEGANKKAPAIDPNAPLPLASTDAMPSPTGGVQLLDDAANGVPISGS